MRFVDVLVRESPKLGHETADKITVPIEAPALVDWIGDAEVRGCVRAG